MKLKLLKDSYHLFLGTWVLRSCNNPFLYQKTCYLIVNYDDTIKFRTLNQYGFLGIKNSISGKITNITKFDNTNYEINFVYSDSNKYTYSLVGIETPEYKFFTKNYLFKKSVNISLYDKTLIVDDNQSNLYYLFDLNIGILKKPNIEISLNNFLFTQVISFIINVFFAQLLHNIFSDHISNF